MVNIMSTENHKDEIEGSEPEKDLHTDWIRLSFGAIPARKIEAPKEMSIAAFILTSPIYRSSWRK